MSPFNMAKVFNVVPKWRNFTKSGHSWKQKIQQRLPIGLPIVSSVL